MQVLIIKRGSLELERIHLNKPMLSVGRSPTNDVVLRAPRVQSLHFLIEWIGSGEFDPSQNLWSISDISVPRDVDGRVIASSEGHSAQPGLGVVLSESTVELSGFRFEVVEDALEVKPVIGGQIRERLEGHTVTYGRALAANSVLELVQIRSDSGSIEDVKHLSLSKFKNVVTPLKSLPQIRMQTDGDTLKVHTDSLAEAQVFNRGQRVLPVQGFCRVSPSDVLHIQWKAFDVYVRFVPMVVVPTARREFFGDPILRKLSAVASVLFLLLLLMLWWPKSTPVLEVMPPQRIATVEIKVEAPEPVEDPPEPPTVVETREADTPTAVTKDTRGVVSQKQVNPGRAAAPRFKGEGSTKPGLNSPAPKTSVNQVGVLGALSGVAKKGPGVNADLVLNSGIVSQGVTGKGDTGVVLRNPPSGVLGSGSSGSPRGSDSGSDLVAAGTTFDGGKDYNPNSTGPISRKGATGTGFSVGATLKGSGDGLAAGSDRGRIELDAGEAADVKGGLDKETVRRVIRGYSGQIRTCFERALVSTKELSGRVVYRWTITPQGPVSTVAVAKSTVNSPEVQACVRDVIQGMIFPAAANKRQTIVNYPFVFRAMK